MIDETKRQRMQYVPETILPDGLLMAACLQLMLAIDIYLCCHAILAQEFLWLYSKFLKNANNY